jgi:acyl-CoA dehydrogenase
MPMTETSLCAREFPDEYHREVDAERAYPEEFVDALTKAGWLAALIPQEYGGSGLGLAEASVIMEEINRCGGNSGACHGQMYNMGTLLRHGSRSRSRSTCRDRQRRAAPAVDGRDRADHRHRHHQDQDHRGEEGRPLRRQRPEGLDLARAALGPDDPAGAHHAAGRGASEEDPRACRSSWSTCAIGREERLTVRPIRNMVNHETNELFFENLEIPAENLIGEEGQGFKYILDGLNAERTLIAAECIGDGYWFIDRAREVHEGARGVRPPDRPEPGRAVPDRRGVHRDRGGQPDALARLRAVRRPPALRRRGQHGQVPGRQGVVGGGQRCLQFHGGFGFAAEYDIERKFRETRLYQVAPISTNLILSYVAEHVLGLPRSF